MIGEHFGDQFLPLVPGGDLEAWAWAREEARRLPTAILACLDPFTVRDRIACYEGDHRRHPERGALANLLLRAVLDQSVAWHTSLIPTRPAAEHGPERGQGVTSDDRPAPAHLALRAASAGHGLPAPLRLAV